MSEKNIDKNDKVEKYVVIRQDNIEGSLVTLNNQKEPVIMIFENPLKKNKSESSEDLK